MIQFAYQSQEVRAKSGSGVDLLYRPKADIRIDGPNGSDEVSALVDTGADETLFPADLAATLGVELRDDDQTVIRGIEGSTTTIWYATVNLEILTPVGGPRWRPELAFISAPSRSSVMPAVSTTSPRSSTVGPRR